MMKVVIQQRIP